MQMNEEESKEEAAVGQNESQAVDELRTENEQLKVQIEKLKQDLDANVASVGAGRTSWDGSMGRGSWGSDQMGTRNKEVEEHLKHVRSIMTQFLSKLPATTKENEDILPILYSMLNFQKPEIDEITEARSKLNEKPGKKGGILGFGGKKK